VQNIEAFSNNILPRYYKVRMGFHNGASVVERMFIRNEMPNEQIHHHVYIQVPPRCSIIISHHSAGNCASTSEFVLLSNSLVDGSQRVALYSFTKVSKTNSGAVKSVEYR
jgi:hypothetical protein